MINKCYNEEGKVQCFAVRLFSPNPSRENIMFGAKLFLLMGFCLAAISALLLLLAGAPTQTLIAVPSVCMTFGILIATVCIAWEWMYRFLNWYSLTRARNFLQKTGWHPCQSPYLIYEGEFYVPLPGIYIMDENRELGFWHHPDIDANVWDDLPCRFKLVALQK